MQLFCVVQNSAVATKKKKKKKVPNIEKMISTSSQPNPPYRQYSPNKDSKSRKNRLSSHHPLCTGVHPLKKKRPGLFLCPRLPRLIKMTNSTNVEAI